MAFLRENGRGQPILRAPVVVVWLIAILVLAHALRVFAFPGPGWLNDYGFVPARYSHNYLDQHGLNPGSLFEQAIPFVSYMFLHGSFAHVAINSVWLLAFGPIVARRFGSPLFLAFFLLCGIAGAAVHLACNWASAEPVIGASAAVSGLMAAAFRMLPFPVRETGLAPILSRRILLWSAIWVAVNVVAGKTGLGTGGGAELVAWQAHLGGYAAGLFLAGPFDAFARSRPKAVPRA